MTWREMYSDPDNVKACHNFKWAVNLIRYAWHCETPELAALDGDWRLVWRSGRPMVVLIDCTGTVLESRDPTPAEVASEHWRLWTEHGRLIRSK